MQINSKREHNLYWKLHELIKEEMSLCHNERQNKMNDHTQMN